MNIDPGYRPPVPALPVRRGTDRLEDAVAWLLGALALLVLVAALVTGADVRARTLDAREVQLAERTPVRAVVLEAPAVVRADNETRALVVVPVRWTGPDGRDQEGRAVLESPVAAGNEVPIWVDRNDRPVPAPVTGTTAVVAGIAAAGAVAASGWAVLYGAWAAVRRFTLARNARAWDEEWTRLEPRWSGREG